MKVIVIEVANGTVSAVYSNADLRCLLADPEVRDPEDRYGELLVTPLDQMRVEIRAPLETGVGLGEDDQAHTGCDSVVQDATGRWHCSHCCNGRVNADGVFIDADDEEEDEDQEERCDECHKLFDPSHGCEVHCAECCGCKII